MPCRQSMVRVVVTGASGFLGGRLCAGLLHAGHSVVALVRKTSKLDELPPQVELTEGDICNAASVHRACQLSCDVVIHCASLVGAWLPDSSQFVKVNVEGLQNVIEAVKANPGIKKLIYTSKFFALGATDGFIADESQFHTMKAFCSSYEESKALADQLAQEAASEGVPVVSLYPGIIYGPGSLTKGNSLAELMIERFSRGEVLVYSENVFGDLDRCVVSFACVPMTLAILLVIISLCISTFYLP